MSSAGDDLAPLLAPDPTAGLDFRQGTVLTWNRVTAENTIDVDGTVLTNLPILNTSEALLLSTGDVVYIITAGKTWFILGRVTIPGTPQAATALAATSIGIDAGVVATTQSTSSTSYTDLTTVGPSATVTIRSTGKCLVIISCQMGSAYTGTTKIGAAVSFASTGANTLGTSAQRSINWYEDHGGVSSAVRTDQFGGTFYLSGLNPGATTFTLKYKSQVTGLNADFADRVIAVIPL